jgi:hypothetical protein
MRVYTVFQRKELGDALPNPLAVCLFQIIQSVYFGLALLNDFAGSNAKTPRARSHLQGLRDGLFTTIAWPMGLVSVWSGIRT